MTRTLVLTFAGAVAAAVLTFGVANANPATGTLDSLRSVGASQSTVEEARWRRCPSPLLAPSWSLALPAPLPSLVIIARFGIESRSAGSAASMRRGRLNPGARRS